MGGNLTDENIISTAVFDAPIGGPQTFLGSFDANGNYTGIGYGSNLSAPPAVPQLPQLPNSVLSQGSAANPTTTGQTTPSSVPTHSNAAPTGASTTTTPSSGIVGGSIADYFIRAVIIILGFIFVGVGLMMFRNSQIPEPISIHVSNAEEIRPEPKPEPKPAKGPKPLPPPRKPTTIPRIRRAVKRTAAAVDETVPSSSRTKAGWLHVFKGEKETGKIWMPMPGSKSKPPATPKPKAAPKAKAAPKPKAPPKKRVSTRPKKAV